MRTSVSRARGSDRSRRRPGLAEQAGEMDPFPARGRFARHHGAPRRGPALQDVGAAGDRGQPPRRAERDRGAACGQVSRGRLQLFLGDDRRACLQSLHVQVASLRSGARFRSGGADRQVAHGRRRQRRREDLWRDDEPGAQHRHGNAAPAGSVQRRRSRIAGHGRGQDAGGVGELGGDDAFHQARRAAADRGDFRPARDGNGKRADARRNLPGLRVRRLVRAGRPRRHSRQRRAQGQRRRERSARPSRSTKAAARSRRDQRGPGNAGRARALPEGGARALGEAREGHQAAAGVRIMKSLARALSLAVLCCAFGEAGAQSWPTRPIRVIVSFPAGSAPDIVCRFVTERLSRAVGQQIIVDNRPGSGNILAGQAAARSAPDGYNFFCATAATLVSNPHTFKSLPYDPARDFVPVAMIAKGPFFVLVHPGVPVKTLAELVAYDKANPGKLAWATDGLRNFTGMMAAWLNKIAGTGILTVPYATMPLGIQDTLAGRTQLVILAVPAAAPRIRSGELRPLAASFAQRVPGFEEVPAISETFPGFELVGWFLVVAPRGTPKDIVLRVNREMDRILKDPETVQRLRGLGFFTEGAETPEAVAEAIRADTAKWGGIVKEIGIQTE